MTLLLGSLVAVTTPTHAGDGDPVWRIDRAPVVQSPSSSGLRHRVASDGAGGVIVTWQHGPDGGIRLQRLDDAGIQRWLPDTGVVLSDSGFNPTLSPDGTGGVVVAWDEPKAEGGKTIRVQRVDAGGTPRWIAEGVQIGSFGSRPIVHVDGSGRAWIGWRDETAAAARVISLDGNGLVASPDVDGLSLGAGAASPGDMRIVSDGIGGAIVVWTDDARPSRILARQLPPSTIWGEAPTVVSSDPGRSMNGVDAVGDEEGGVLISWVATGEDQQVRVQRLDSEGRARWVPDGVVVLDSDVVAGDRALWKRGISTRVASAGEGGAIVAWTDWRNATPDGRGERIYMQRVEASGVLGWAAGGVPLLTPSAGAQTSPEIAGDGTGGVVVTYEHTASDPAHGLPDAEVAAARIDPDGNRRWHRFIYVDRPTAAPFDQLRPRIVVDTSGLTRSSAIITWRDGEDADLYATKLQISSPSNDSCAQAIDLATGTHAGTLVAGSLDGSSSCGGEISDVWYRVVAPGDGTLKVDTCGTNDIGGVDGGVDTVLSLHAACPDGGGNYELTCNDDWPGSANVLACDGIDLGGFFGDSYVEAAATLGEPVLIRVSRFPDEIDGPFQLRVGFVPAPGPNDDCRNATLISPGSFVGTLVGATTDGEASCNDPPGPDLWYRLTAFGDGAVFIDTCGSNDSPGEDLGVDTVLSVHSACPTGPNPNEIPGACNDDWYFGNDPTACDGIDQGADLDSALVLDVVAAQDYLIRVSRYAGTPDGEFRLNVDALFDPAGYVPDGSAVPGNPLRVTRLAGDTVRLSWDPSCMSSDTGFAVYRGDLGSYTTHEPVACDTGGATQWDSPVLPGSHYFLVVPHNTIKEGSQGLSRDLAGNLLERPEPSLSCLPRTIQQCQ